MQQQLTALTQKLDKSIKVFTKNAQHSYSTRSSEASSNDNALLDQLQNSDQDYPRSEQPQKGKGRQHNVTKESTRKPQRTARKRKRPPSPSSDSSRTTTTEDSDRADSSPTERKRKARKVVNDLLKAAAPSRTAKAGKHNFYVHKFITRGNSFEKVGLGHATFPEYLAAMKEMVRHPDCPKGWVTHIMAHEEQLVIMAKKWEWPTCRLWTESVFMFINKSGVHNAWTRTNTIVDLQRDVTSTGKRVSSVTDTFSNRADYGRRAPQYYQKALSVEEGSSRSTSDSYRQGFEKDKDGKPCYAWNWGRDCGYTDTHGAYPELRPHVCAFCAYKLHKVFKHKEKDCINKQRNVDKLQPLAILPAKDFQ